MLEAEELHMQVKFTGWVKSGEWAVSLLSYASDRLARAQQYIGLATRDFEHGFKRQGILDMFDRIQSFSLIAVRPVEGDVIHDAHGRKHQRPTTNTNKKPTQYQELLENLKAQSTVAVESQI